MQKFSGTYHFKAERKRVYEALIDPKVIQRTIEGCQEIKEVGPHSYEVLVAVNTMGFRTNQPVAIQLEKLRPPSSYVMGLKAKSQFGTVQSKVDVRIEPNESGSVLHYDAETQLTGLAAAMGSRMLEVTVKRLLEDFFGKLDQQL